MLFCFTKTLAGGCPPDPRTTLSRAARGGCPTWPVPGSPRPNLRKPRHRGARGTRPADWPPRRLGLCARRSSPSPGRAGARPSDRDVWTGFLPSGVGRDSTPAEGTDGVRAGGRGDRRRSGGNAAAAASPVNSADSAAKPTVGDRSGDSRTPRRWRNPQTAHVAGAEPNGGSRGAEHPSPVAMFNIACAGSRTLAAPETPVGAASETRQPQPQMRWKSTAARHRSV